MLTVNVVAQGFLRRDRFRVVKLAVVKQPARKEDARPVGRSGRVDTRSELDSKFAFYIDRLT